MEIHGLHGVARVKEMEMAHCISYALGHPRTVGVSACCGFLRELFQRVDQQYYLIEYFHYNIGGLSTQCQSLEYAQLIYIRGLSI